MNEIKVLWLDDESEEMLSNEDWRAQFEDEGIVLHAEKYAEQFVERLKDNPGAWDLVLLDAIGYKKEGSGLNKAGLSYAIQQVQKVAALSNVNLPIFIYTGQDSLFEDDEFIDSYSDVPIYRKGWTGTEKLIENIKKLASTREDRAVMDMYPKVFAAIDSLGLKESEQKLLGFLKAVHYKEYRLHRTPITDLRIILEELFHALIKPEIGLIPQECYKSDKKELNMADIILYMSGEQTKSEFGKAPAYGGVGVVDLEGPIYPALMSSFINTLYVYVSATDSHVKRIIDDEKTEFKNQCMQYSAKVEGSYIGFSFAYQICDILTYTAAYVKNHPDPVMNRCRVYQLRDDHNSGCKIETTDGIMHYGKYCWADSSEFNDGESLNLKKIKLETTPKGVFKYKISKKK
jgi:hypothetical protein